MRGLAILFLFHLAGSAVERIAGAPLPGNVIGLVLLLTALLLGWVKLEWIEESANFLMKHMLLLFAPIVVGTIQLWPLLRDEWLPIAASLLLGPAAVVVSTALTAKLWPGGAK
ncbi:CidA/LrgA family protein [Paenibacillus sp.]|uniref:CidA/LrgA family protein n=1 Tax=Paenibacillus sp. TaxID=58172 RepID=UPI002D73347D|nr:CidA/LrgA family protein [Paenibacillus sp.]HZG85022.1 CidA/LrgA family protein [Paenibacillus sp.]